DDAAQEAFVRAFGFLHRFRPGAPFRPWLLTVVANVARNQSRSTHRWTRATRAPGERGIAATNAPSAEDVALTRGRDGTVRAARSSAVSRQLQASPARARPRERARRRRLVAVRVATIAVTATLAIPTARAAVTSFFDIGAVRVHEEPPPGGRATAGPLLLGDL